MNTTSRPRVAALDVARGIAIAGTLATNIWIFSHVGGLIGYLNQPTSLGAPGWQQGAERFGMALANGKFLGLLTIMFGIGLAIQAESARRRGHPWPGGYPVRAALLFAEGLLHYLLIAEFDVLMGYAVVSLLVARLVVAAPRIQRGWMIVCAAVHTALVLLGTWGLAIAGPEEPRPLAPNPYRDGSWWDLVEFRIDNLLLFRLEPVAIFTLSVAMFLAGAWLWRSGVFDERGLRLRRGLIVVGAVAAVADLTLAMLWPPSILVCRYLLAPVVAFGLLALIAQLVRTGRGWWSRRAADVGRVALSAYILQNLICGFLFQGWGIGLNAMPPTHRLPVTVAVQLGVVALLAAAAYAWNRRFGRGPVEWVWHRAADRIAAGLGLGRQHPVEEV
ncbi:DUF418 domain-containing protein [Naumannella sp. ID2617S]|uniref:DUF418 domain-containing protein n=1 Tax=Enemella dayhoffiae TaxID=2016507 RepID=A0A255H9H7_9ACTN|nr:DUF418 domain-containing protein [Enemella dayhoffiae]NNG20838.1 DUF418 domain-containing protein [Naumannella sp. ID2617S]OYO24092.1 hypothetical protein CGZ93_04535 [Enemella dayhoffiae]